MEIHPIKNHNYKTFFKKKFCKSLNLFKKVVPQKNVTENNSNIFYEEQRLIESIKEAKNEWLTADTNFQYVSENEFIEYYTYKLKAAQIKYEFFLKKAKEKGLKVNSDIFSNSRDIDLS